MTNKGDYSILVIEDNLGDFTLVKEFLLEQVPSVTIIHAKNFEESKKLLIKKNIDFDAVLLDLSLPDKRGLPLIQEIIEMCANIPVIVLTGYSDFAFGVKSLTLGISDYILKDELTSISLYKSIVYSSERKKTILALENYIKVIEEQNEKLRKISWHQSHVIRAPLVRLMGLVDMLKDVNNDDKEKQKMLEYLLVTADELDKVIMNITDLSGTTEL
jgi:response regulator RpfG family c-di-GMP phosphodiesterase